MHDKYLNFSQSPLGKKLCRLVGLPTPAKLIRAQTVNHSANNADSAASTHVSNQGLVPRVVIASVLENFSDSRNADILKNALQECSLQCQQGSLKTFLQDSTEKPGNTHKLENADKLDTADQINKVDGVVFDATGISSSEQLDLLFEFFSVMINKVALSGKITIIGMTPGVLEKSSNAIAQRSLVGFVKSLAKELGRKGITVNLLMLNSCSFFGIEGSIRFLQSYRSAYVNGQVINISDGEGDVDSEITALPKNDWGKPLQNKIALVTGASRGIGAEIAKVLARDGAKVIGLDIPQAEPQLNALMNSIGGESLCLDLSRTTAPEQLAKAIKKLTGRVDIVVHNAGITRDKMLSKMSLEKWQQVISVNLSAVEATTDYLLDEQLIGEGGRIIGVSSISGIAGNIGQTNYGTSKAGIIGLVDRYARLLDDRKITVNAVAPGFIETEMTASIPFMTRQVGRRLCSLSQGGLPIDVAETIAFIASPASQTVNGNTIRVCGQNLLGA